MFLQQQGTPRLGSRHRWTLRATQLPEPLGLALSIPVLVSILSVMESSGNRGRGPSGRL